MIESMDDSIGRLTRKLEQMGLGDDTARGQKQKPF
jgi:arylsulfatase A-like enzyme